jgi:hypothetical protein
MEANIDNQSKSLSGTRVRCISEKLVIAIEQPELDKNAVKQLS